MSGRALGVVLGLLARRGSRSPTCCSRGRPASWSPPDGPARPSWGASPDAPGGSPRWASTGSRSRWSSSLRRVPLVVVQPLLAFGLVGLVLGARLFLGEHVDTRRIGAAFVVALGITLVVAGAPASSGPAGLGVSAGSIVAVGVLLVTLALPSSPPRVRRGVWSPRRPPATRSSRWPPTRSRSRGRITSGSRSPVFSSSPPAG